MRKVNHTTTFLLIFVVALLNHSCKNHITEVIEFDSFEIEKDIVAQDAKWINNYSSISPQIIDSILFLIDMYNENYFYFYNLNNHELLTSFGNRGKGPDEYYDLPESKEFSYKEGEKVFFYLMGRGKGRINEISKINLLESLMSGKMVIEEKIEISYKIPSNFIFNLDDSIYVGSGRDERGTIFLYNVERDSIFKWQKRTKLKGFGTVHEKSKFLVNNEHIKVSPDRKRIVSRLTYLKRIHIYDNEGDIIRILIDKNNKGLDLSSRIPTCKSNDFYGHHSISSKHILVYNSSYNRVEYNQINEIYIFDYSGNAIAKFNLDRFIYGLVMDWNTNRLYGYDNENDHFVFYQLTGL